MYSHLHDLQSNPFSSLVDTKYFWSGKPYSMALVVLKEALLNGENFLVLTGDYGIGKTTLIKHLKKDLLPDYISIAVGSEIEDPNDLFDLITRRTGIRASSKKKGAFFVHFNQYLHNLKAENKKILFIIDDFCQMDDILIKELKFLSDIKIEGQNVTSILIACEDTVLSSAKINDLANSSVFTHHIKQINRSEINNYIDHMFRAADTKNKTFSQKVIQKIFQFSQGNPREINRICSRALNLGHELKLRNITPATIEECCQELYNPGGRQTKIQASIPQKRNQINERNDDFSRRFANLNQLVQQINFPDIDIQTTIDGFKKVLAKSYSVSKDTLKKIFVQKHIYLHAKKHILRIFDLGLWNSVLLMGLFFVALVFSIWYQIILPYGLNPPNIAELKKTPDNPNISTTDFHDKKITQPSVPSKERTINILNTDQQLLDADRTNEVKLKIPVKPSESYKAAYFVQVGAFLYKKNATKIESELRKKGYSVKIVKFHDSKDRLWHTVRIGEYVSLKLAKKDAIKFSKQEKMEAIVLPNRK